MSKASIDLIETAKQDITKAKEELKADLQSEINIAELMKHDIFAEINAEKEILEKSLKIVTEEIRKVEKFNTNRDVMENLSKQSEEAFWKMSSNIEIIKAKEENINTFMNNINLPLGNWIYFGLRENNSKRNGYTIGLKEFGFKEIEIIDSEKTFEEIYKILYDLSHHVLLSQTDLRPGETFGYSQTEKFAIDIGAGEFQDGETIKVTV